MEQTEQKRLVEGVQEHESAGSLSEQSQDVKEAGNEKMFLCKYRNHMVPISKAARKGEKPEICSECSAVKRREARQQEEQERQAKLATLDEIPAPDGRGPTKRVTYSLHQYVVTALDVLAVGSSPSDVVERAVIRFLEDQDQQVVAFVNRMFTQAICK